MSERGEGRSSRGLCSIVCFANIDWRDVKQRHQILMEGLSGPNRAIFFVETLGVRAPRLGALDARRVVRRLLNAFKPKRTDEGNGADVKVVSPIVAPEGWPLGGALNRTFFHRRVMRQLNLPEENPTIAWVYLPTKGVTDLLDRLDPEVIVYDCTINFQHHPAAPTDIQRTEGQLLRRADVVFADAESLFRRCKEVNPNTHRLLPGVHLELFKRPEAPAGGPEPPEFLGLPRPLALYFGAAKAIHFDWRLFRAIADRLTEWSFAMVGPVEAEVSAGLGAAKNVHLLGPREHSDLPGYLWAADVILLPYRVNEFTAGTFPAKVYECLASGTPIVSTPLPELERQFPEHIMFGSDAESLALALVASTEDDPGARARRVELAEQNSWSERVRCVEEVLSELLSQ